MVRSRCFPVEDGIGEDEATGSAARFSPRSAGPLTITRAGAHCSTPCRWARAAPKSAAGSS